MEIKKWNIAILNKEKNIQSLKQCLLLVKVTITQIIKNKV